MYIMYIVHMYNVHCTYFIRILYILCIFLCVHIILLVFCGHVCVRVNIYIYICVCVYDVLCVYVRVLCVCILVSYGYSYFLFSFSLMPKGCSVIVGL